MEGLSRRSVPPVVRSFVPSRLAEDLWSGVYERLLEGSRPGEASNGGDDEPTEHDALEALATGGRS